VKGTKTQTSKKEGKESKTQENPEYLGRASGKEIKTMTRFRCGNEEKGNRYWMEEEGRRCRLCYKEREKETDRKKNVFYLFYF
jgi:hypothetical protein